MSVNIRFAILAPVLLLSGPGIAHAHGGLGSLEVFYYIALFAMALVAVGVFVSIPCMIKASQLKRLGRTDERLFRVLKAATVTSLLLSSPVFLLLFALPGLWFIAFVAGAAYVAMVVGAVKVFKQDSHSTPAEGTWS